MGEKCPQCGTENPLFIRTREVMPSGEVKEQWTCIQCVKNVMGVK